MSKDPPALQLSDFLLHVSPSPEPQPEDVSGSSSRSATPEPVEAEEMEEMRRRVLAMRGPRSKGKEKESTWESELVTMVLRLTSTAPPSRSQLVAQAEAIAHLSQQRQYLLDRAEEERTSWEAERESWSRTAEALIAQVNKAGPSIYREQDPGKHAATTESDNYVLRQKLSEAQSRLANLSSELAQLKPLLLMQPYALAHSHSHSALDTTKARKKKKEATEPDSVDLAEESAVVEDGPSTPKQQRAKPGQYYRRREDHLYVQPPPVTSKKQRAPTTPNSKSVASGGPPLPTMSDARSEHLLLAARKIGRERASLLSAMHYQSTAPKTEQELAHPFSPTTPKTPRKAPLHSVIFQSPIQAPPPPGSATHVQGMYEPPHSYSFVPTRGYPPYPPMPYTFMPYPINSPALHPSPKSQARQPPAANAVTPQPFSHYRKPAASPSKSGPLTPLESLLSAAQSVLSPASDMASPSKGKQTRRQSAQKTTRTSIAEHPDSPMPKRRRIESEASRNPSGLGRKMSALDVLADQAMVFSSGAGRAEDPGPDVNGGSDVDRRSGRTQPPRRDRRRTRAKVKGKGKEQEVESLLDKSGSASDMERSESAQDPMKGLSPPQPLSTHIHEQRGNSAGPSMRRNRGDEPHSPLAPPITLSRESSTDKDEIAVDSLAMSARRSQAHYRLRTAGQDAPEHGDGGTGLFTRSRSMPIPRPNAPPDAPMNVQVRTRSLTPVDNPPRLHGSSRSENGRFLHHGQRNGRNGTAGKSTSRRRETTPQVHWSKEEDDMLTDAVAEHGQKWEQVQKSVPLKGQEQVRQRWLRKLGVSPAGDIMPDPAPALMLNLASSLSTVDPATHRPFSPPGNVHSTDI